ncbi:MAG: pilus assembly protein TadG-related protein, partial [Planctomycetota bacterium]
MPYQRTNAAARSGRAAGRHPRRGAILVLSSLLIIVVCAMAAMAVDTGYMMLVKTQLQVAADAGALAATNTLHKTRAEINSVGIKYCTEHECGGRPIRADEVTVEIGIWDVPSEAFSATSGIGNAVRVTCRRENEALFFARVIGRQNFTTEATAIAMANPKDIAFVVDLSGSMNDDTEPAWATTTVNAAFATRRLAGIGSDLMRDVYSDFGFGAFPGRLEYLGAPIGVPRGSMAYAEMTSDTGPLSASGVPAQFRIAAGDNEQTRREKCYGWIIENQLRRLMPGARPSADLSNYRYWEKYIDYVLKSSHVIAPKPPAPPKNDDDDDDDDDD